MGETRHLRKAAKSLVLLGRERAERGRGEGRVWLVGGGPGDPELLTLEFMKADRGGRIFMDINRNDYGATFACAYAVRARPGAPVSAPCTWDEIADGSVGPTSFTVRTMLDRVAKLGDLWSEMAQTSQSAKDALAQLGGPPDDPSPARRRFR